MGGKERVELGDLERYGSRDRMVINQTRTMVVASEPRVPSPVARMNGGTSRDSTS